VPLKNDRVANIRKSRRHHHKNHQIYSKKWSFALLLLTNPLPLTIRHNITMELVAIGVLLSLTLGQQRVIIMVILVIFFFSDFGW
jgi:hypothetical protein